MVAACGAPNPGAPVAAALADYVDCHAQALGESGFRALAGGWIGPALLGSCLTLYVGLLGYRMILGHAFTPREAVLACVRAGIVIAFCTSWPSYQAVVYRVVAEGPSELADAMLSPLGLAQSAPAAAAGRLSAAYEAIQASTPPPQPAPIGAPMPGLLLQQPQSGPASITWPGVAFLTSTLGGFLAVRLAAGLLLAIGPVIIALGLFDTWLGFVEGWIRALLGTALASLGATVVTALELGFVEAEIAGAGAPNPLLGQGLMVAAILFGLVMWGVVIFSGILAGRFRLRLSPFRSLTNAVAQAQTASGAQLPAVRPSMTISVPENRSRAQAVADAVTIQGQRERDHGAGAPSFNVRLASVGTPVQAADLASSQSPLGSSLRRSSGGRRSQSIDRREGRR